MVYFRIYLRYDFRCYRCPYPPFPFSNSFPDTGTGSDYLNRTLLEFLTQPLFKQTS